ncbi:basic proline-rich protein-like isoform X1 [Vitis riparia]|uniref:basic proline-rich protein-like isoform X1 n=1 Tax=Vitis riparia TaxID=96939 RepID=UPI00155A1622|nr:basic proline-rich protein-like isoform X1 [Vitis riparia]
MDLHRSTLLQTDQAVDKHFNRENCKFHADDLHVHGIIKRKLDDIVNKNLKPFAICCLKNIASRMRNTTSLMEPKVGTCIRQKWPVQDNLSVADMKLIMFKPALLLGAQTNISQLLQLPQFIGGISPPGSFYRQPNGHQCLMSSDAPRPGASPGSPGRTPPTSPPGSAPSPGHPGSAPPPTDPPGSCAAPPSSLGSAPPLGSPDAPPPSGPPGSEPSPSPPGSAPPTDPPGSAVPPPGSTGAPPPTGPPDSEPSPSPPRSAPPTDPPGSAAPPPGSPGAPPPTGPPGSEPPPSSPGSAPPPGLPPSPPRTPGAPSSGPLPRSPPRRSAATPASLLLRPHGRPLRFPLRRGRPGPSPLGLPPRQSDTPDAPPPCSPPKSTAPNRGEASSSGTKGGRTSESENRKNPTQRNWELKPYPAGALSAPPTTSVIHPRRPPTSPPYRITGTSKPVPTPYTGIKPAPYHPPNYPPKPTAPVPTPYTGRGKPPPYYPPKSTTPNRREESSLRTWRECPGASGSRTKGGSQEPPNSGTKEGRQEAAGSGTKGGSQEPSSSVTQNSSSAGGITNELENRQNPTQRNWELRPYPASALPADPPKKNKCNCCTQ